MTAVHISALRKTYDTRSHAQALDQLDLSIEDGEFFVLLGPSGCGKTTTLRCVAGLEEPTQGEIRIGATLVAAPQRGLFVPPEKRRTGMVFQSYALWPHMTVFDNVAYPLRLRKRADAALVREVEQALALVGLEGMGARHPTQLSGGQQQRVALARALVGDTDLLLFDEPLSNLDAQLRLRLRQDLRRIQRATGRTALYVTHDQQEALALADRIAVLRAGRLEQLGTPQAIYTRPATRFVAEFVGFDNFWPARLQRHDGASASVLADELGLALQVQLPAAPPAAFSGLAIRSEHLRARPAGAPARGPNHFSGRLLDASYVGNGYLATVELPTARGPAQIAAALHPGDWSAPAGPDRIAPQDVTVSVAPEHIHLL